MGEDVVPFHHLNLQGLQSLQKVYRLYRVCIRRVLLNQEVLGDIRQLQVDKEVSREVWVYILRGQFLVLQ